MAKLKIQQIKKNLRWIPCKTPTSLTNSNLTVSHQFCRTFPSGSCQPLPPTSYLDLVQFPKVSTPQTVYQTHFFEIVSRHPRATLCFTDGSKLHKRISLALSIAIPPPSIRRNSRPSSYAWKNLESPLTNRTARVPNNIGFVGLSARHFRPRIVPSFGHTNPNFTKLSLQYTYRNNLHVGPRPLRNSGQWVCGQSGQTSHKTTCQCWTSTYQLWPLCNHSSIHNQKMIRNLAKPEATPQ